MSNLSDLDLLLSSVREIDQNIKETRDHLNQLYDYRRVLVDRIAELAAVGGYEHGYSNGEYRYKVVHSYRVTDPEAIEQVAPQLVKREVVLKVDNRQLQRLMETSFSEQLAPYVVAETRHEVEPEERKTVKRAITGG